VSFGGIVVESGEVDGVELGVAVVPVDGLTPVVPAAPVPGVPVVDGELPFTLLVPLVELVPEMPVELEVAAALVPFRPFGLVALPDVVPTADPVCPAVPVPMVPAAPVVP
jgi:hypothetical protein